MDEQDAGFININLDDVDDGREPLPDGIYECIVKSAAKKKKEGKEFPYIDVRLKPEHPDYAKRTLFLTLSFYPKALWNMKLFCKAANVAWTSRGFALAELIGKRVAVTVGTRPEQEGKEAQNEIKPPYNKL